MKRNHIYLLLALAVCGLFGAGSARAQGTLIHLEIDSMVNFPDSAYQGQIYSDQIVVRNSGNTPYQGTLQIAVKVDTNYDYIYFNQTVITILPGDTVQLVPFPGFVFDSALFKTGNNVAVVWPLSSQAITVDTMIRNVVFYANPSIGVGENPGIQGLQLYPNPAHDFIEISSPQNRLESVRILDMEGRLIRKEDLLSEQKQRISVLDLPAGTYLIEILAENKQKMIQRFIKTQ